MPKITPFLWFDSQAEEALRFYVSVFPHSRMKSVSAMSCSADIDGQEVVALNGGPHHRLNEAFSFVIDCETQAEVDQYWEKLTAGGEPGPCGWLKDRFGLSWQVVPRRLPQLLQDPDPGRASRAVAAMMKMSRIDIAALEAAADAR